MRYSPVQYLVLFLNIQTFISSPVVKYSNLNDAEYCRYALSDSNMQLQIWENARRVLSLDKRTTCSCGTHCYYSPLKVFTTHHGSMLYNISGVPVQYISNYKGGSMNIKANLAANQLRSSGNLYMYNTSNVLIASKQMLRNFGFSDFRDVPSFTFVREPLEHFAAGLTEYHWWLKQHGPVSEISRSKVKEQIEQFLDCQLPIAKSIHSVMHLYPQSGILTKYSPTYVGKLEQFQDDWTKINSMYHINMTFAPLVHHVTSDDPFHSRDIFWQVLREEPIYLKALCILLEVDYKCFKYSISKYCSSLQQKTRL